ncbi:MAG: hypothetical protein ACI82G_000560 [Bradymonadia bacterium]|jgi:hypothetical protein
MSETANLTLWTIDGREVGGVSLVQNEVQFADPDVTWTWVLDARHPPYCDMPLKAVLHRAEGARKRYVLTSSEG